MLSNKTLKYILLLNMLNDAGSTMFADELGEKLDMTPAELDMVGRAMSATGFINYERELGAFTLIKDIWEISMPNFGSIYIKDWKALLSKDASEVQALLQNSMNGKSAEPDTNGHES